VSGVSDLVTKDGDGVAIAVHVQPGAGRTSVVGRHGDALKLRVAAPPVDDRANTAAAGLLAEVLGVKAADVELVSGQRSRMKRFRVRGLDHDEALELIEHALDDATTPPGPKRRRPGGA
jgi:hypothetical protein